MDPASDFEFGVPTSVVLQAAEITASSTRIRLEFQALGPVSTTSGEFTGPDSNQAEAQQYALYLFDHEARLESRVVVWAEAIPATAWHVEWLSADETVGSDPFFLLPGTPILDAAVEVRDRTLTVSWQRSDGPRLRDRFLWGAMAADIRKIATYDPFAEEAGRPLEALARTFCPETRRRGRGERWSKDELASFPNSVEAAPIKRPALEPPTSTEPTPQTGEAEVAPCDDGAFRRAIDELRDSDEGLAALGPYRLVGLKCEDGYAKLSLIDEAMTLQGITFLFRSQDGRWVVMNEYGSGVCSTDAARYEIPPAVWEAIGGNEIVSC